MFAFHFELNFTDITELSKTLIDTIHKFSKEMKINTGNNRTRSREYHSVFSNERTSSVVVCEPTPVTMESSLREVGHMWQLRSGNFTASRSFLPRSTRLIVEGVVYVMDTKKYDMIVPLNLTVVASTIISIDLLILKFCFILIMPGKTFLVH